MSVKILKHVIWRVVQLYVNSPSPPVKPTGTGTGRKSPIPNGTMLYCGGAWQKLLRNMSEKAPSYILKAGSEQGHGMTGTGINDTLLKSWVTICKCSAKGQMIPEYRMARVQQKQHKHPASQKKPVLAMISMMLVPVLMNRTTCPSKSI